MDETVIVPGENIIVTSELPAPQTSAPDAAAHIAGTSESGGSEESDADSYIGSGENEHPRTSSHAPPIDPDDPEYSWLKAPALLPVVQKDPNFRPLPYSSSRTGFVYDPRMGRHSMVQLEVDDPHPERPDRIFGIEMELRQTGLLTDSEDETDFHLLRIEVPLASRDDLLRIHNEQHVDRMLASTSWTIDEHIEFSRHGDSLFTNSWTYYCALLSAGGTITATRAVLGGHVKNAVAIVRPPGHHAEHDRAGGFCIFNNVPIAVRAAQKEFPDKCRKVLILDWDVHHGNGIQNAFYNDPNVLYISLHVYKGKEFYPTTDEGDHVHCGTGPGLGKNVNIPWSDWNRTDSDYILAFQQIVMPIATEFDPDLVMISAGFDAAEGDPLGWCHVSPAGFAHMTHMLKELANGKVVAVLEGGYNVHSISVSATAMTRVLMGEPPERLGELTSSEVGVKTVQLVLRTQATFWNSLQPKTQGFVHEKDSPRLHDIIREWQAKRYFEDYQMTSVPVLKQEVSQSYKDRVLATRYFTNDERPLLVLFHDAPEAEGDPFANYQSLELHKIRITDYGKLYVEWATKHDFAVMDVNTPRFLTGADSEDERITNAQRKQNLARSVIEIAYYLWQNYIELGCFKHIIFMAIGDSSPGITELFTQHNEIFNKVKHTVCLIQDSSLGRVISDTDPEMAKTYYRTSTIFVSDEHPAFLPDTKLKKSHGNVIKSAYKNVQQMLKSHMDQVTETLLRVTASTQDRKLPPGPDRTEIRSENPIARTQGPSTGTMLADAMEEEMANINPPPIPTTETLTTQSPPLTQNTTNPLQNFLHPPSENQVPPPANPLKRKTPSPERSSGSRQAATPPQGRADENSEQQGNRREEMIVVTPSKRSTFNTTTNPQP